MNNALKAAGDLNSRSYTGVEVLNIHWENAESEVGLGLKHDLKMWIDLCNEMGWKSHTFTIPNVNSRREFFSALKHWDDRVQTDNGRRPLGIIYYNGHSLRRTNQSTVWVG